MFNSLQSFQVRVASEEFGVSPVIAHHQESKNATMANSFSLDLFTDSYFQKDSKIHPNTELLIGKDIYAQISWDIREPGSKVQKNILKNNR